MRLRYLGFLGIVSLMAVVLAACGGGASPTATTAPKATATTAAMATTMPTTGAPDYTLQLKGPAAGNGTGSFTPATLSLTAGKAYAIKLVGDAEFHTFSLRDPKDATKYLVNEQVLPNESKTIQFMAPPDGKYVFVCIPHEAQGMKGQITTTM